MQEQLRAVLRVFVLHHIHVDDLPNQKFRSKTFFDKGLRNKCTHYYKIVTIGNQRIIGTRGREQKENKAPISRIDM